MRISNEEIQDELRELRNKVRKLEEHLAGHKHLEGDAIMPAERL